MHVQLTFTFKPIKATYITQKKKRERKFIYFNLRENLFDLSDPFNGKSSRDNVQCQYYFYFNKNKVERDAR